MSPMVKPAPAIHSAVSSGSSHRMPSRARSFIPAAAEGMKERARDGIRWLEPLLTAEWIAGAGFTIGDIFLYGYLDELADKGQPIPDDCIRLKRWFDAVGARPAAEMSQWRA